MRTLMNPVKFDVFKSFKHSLDSLSPSCWSPSVLTFSLLQPFAAWFPPPSDKTILCTSRPRCKKEKKKKAAASELLPEAGCAVRRREQGVVGWKWDNGVITMGRCEYSAGYFQGMDGEYGWKCLVLLFDKRLCLPGRASRVSVKRLISQNPLNNILFRL